MIKKNGSLVINEIQNSADIKAHFKMLMAHRVFLAFVRVWMFEWVTQTLHLLEAHSTKRTGSQKFYETKYLSGQFQRRSIETADKIVLSFEIWIFWRVMFTRPDFFFHPKTQKKYVQIEEENVYVLLGK